MTGRTTMANSRVAMASGWEAVRERDVRVCRAYRLWPSGTLPDRHLQTLVGLGVDPGRGFGLLVAEPGSGLPDKLVDADAAELVTALQRPGRLPGWAAGQVAELVLDGVIEVDSDAGFVAGPAAYEAIIGPARHPEPTDRLGRLSYAALAYAERLRLPDAGQLTARLYAYHRVPLSHRWSAAYPDSHAVRDLLTSPDLLRRWTGTTAGGWLTWARKSNPGGAFPYKLYVSPHIRDVPAALPALVSTLTSAGVARFKVGADAPGLLRPDKIVVYLASAVELSAVATAVAGALAGLAPHGVPFSAELAGDGLLSWGGDPDAEAGPVGAGPESWRLAVCRLLAESLVAATAAVAAGRVRQLRPVDFALARLAAAGVDIRSFAPAALDPPQGK